MWSMRLCLRGTRKCWLSARSDLRLGRLAYAPQEIVHGDAKKGKVFWVAGVQAFCCDTPRTCGAILRALHIESRRWERWIEYIVLTLVVRMKYIGHLETLDCDHGLKASESSCHVFLWLVYYSTA